MERDDVIGKRFVPEEMPEVIAGKHQSPNELVKANAFGGAYGAHRAETFCAVSISQHIPHQRTASQRKSLWQYRGNELAYRIDAVPPFSIQALHYSLFKEYKGKRQQVQAGTTLPCLPSNKREHPTSVPDYILLISAIIMYACILRNIDFQNFLLNRRLLRIIF